MYWYLVHWAPDDPTDGFVSHFAVGLNIPSLYFRLRLADGCRSLSLDPARLHSLQLGAGPSICIFIWVFFVSPFLSLSFLGARSVCVFLFAPWNFRSSCTFDLSWIAISLYRLDNAHSRCRTRLPTTLLVVAADNAHSRCRLSTLPPVNVLVTGRCPCPRRITSHLRYRVLSIFIHRGVVFYSFGRLSCQLFLLTCRQLGLVRNIDR